MAYLHCHTPKCDWSQDDFWYWKVEWKKLFKWGSRPFGYNPLSLILEDIAAFYKPQYIEYDEWFATENGFKNRNIFSWHMMIWSIQGDIKKLFTQKWWTIKSWNKAKATAVCPDCGKRNFDID